MRTPRGRGMLGSSSPQRRPLAYAPQWPDEVHIGEGGVLKPIRRQQQRDVLQPPPHRRAVDNGPSLDKSSNWVGWAGKKIFHPLRPLSQNGHHTNTYGKYAYERCTYNAGHKQARFTRTTKQSKEACKEEST